MQPTGKIVEVIRNDKGLYDGDLAHYFRALVFYGQNLRNPYHNLRHMLHVAWLCHEAISFYGPSLNRRSRRNLLIAALFHDFDHSGRFGDDDLNIERAVRGLGRHIALADAQFVHHIGRLIRATEFPHRVFPPEDFEEDLSIAILRDADVSQALNEAWIQQVVIGLATEWSKPPLEVLRAQGGFHKSIKFTTEWAQVAFPPEAIEAKVKEAEDLLELLEDAPKL